MRLAMSYLWIGKSTGRMEATARGRNGRYQLPASPSNDNAAVTLGVAERRPTMYIASTDIRTAHDVARPKPIPNIFPITRKKGVEGHAAFDNVEIKFDLTSLPPPAERRSAPLWLKNASGGG